MEVLVEEILEALRANNREFVQAVKPASLLTDFDQRNRSWTRLTGVVAINTFLWILADSLIMRLWL